MGERKPAGKIGKLFGHDGGLLITLYDAFPDDHDSEEPLYVRLDGLAVPLFVERFERRGRRGAAVRFADVDTPERAAELVGEEIFICGEGERDDEMSLDALVGYRFTIAGETVEGTVTGFVDSAMNPLFQLDAGGSELLIPARDEFVESIDPRTRVIAFVLPEGLLELYL